MTSGRSVGATSSNSLQRDGAPSHRNLPLGVTRGPSGAVWSGHRGEPGGLSCHGGTGSERLRFPPRSGLGNRARPRQPAKPTGSTTANPGRPGDAKPRGSTDHVESAGLPKAADVSGMSRPTRRSSHAGYIRRLIIHRLYGPNPRSFAPRRCCTAPRPALRHSGRREIAHNAPCRAPAQEKSPQETSQRSDFGAATHRSLDLGAFGVVLTRECRPATRTYVVPESAPRCSVRRRFSR